MKNTIWMVLFLAVAMVSLAKVTINASGADCCVPVSDCCSTEASCCK